MSATEAAVAEVNRRDLRHVRGFRFSDVPTSTHMLPYLRAEVAELDRALLHRDAWLLMSEVDGTAEVLQELADIFACVMQIAYREGDAFEALDARAARKIRERFVEDEAAAR
jgi:NTP pyrophosphatase (non-canonical NTP hydrolase)